VFVLDEILIPETFTPTGQYADKLALLADEVAYRTSTREEYQKGDWINFHRDKWKFIDSKKYGPIKQAAIEQGLIEVNEAYSSSTENSKGQPFPKSLRLTKQHRNSQLIPYKLSKSIKRNSQTIINISDTDAVGTWLASKLDIFDLPEGLDITPIEALCNTTHKRNCLRASMLRLKQRRFFASRCEFGRFHSNYTNMKKELRRELTFNGEKLIPTDIVNCQPALLPHVLGRHIGGCCDCCWSDLDPSIVDKIYMFACRIGSIFGSFYERAIISLNPSVLQTSLTASQMDRERLRMKKLFYKSLYGEISTTKRSKLFQLLNAVSPLFGRAILEIKAGNHSNLAHQLQKLESKIVIDSCCRNLMIRFPAMPVITVHDEILTTPKYKSFVENELQLSFMNECGYWCVVEKPVINSLENISTMNTAV